MAHLLNLEHKLRRSICQLVIASFQKASAPCQRSRSAATSSRTWAMYLLKLEHILKRSICQLLIPSFQKAPGPCQRPRWAATDGRTWAMRRLRFPGFCKACNFHALSCRPVWQESNGQHVWRQALRCPIPGGKVR